jgi:hypothetical protein
MDKHLCNKFPLEKGLYYTKAGVGVTRPDFRKSYVEVNDEQFLLISIKNEKYLNELHTLKPLSSTLAMSYTTPAMISNATNFTPLD